MNIKNYILLGSLAFFTGSCQSNLNASSTISQTGDTNFIKTNSGINQSNSGASDELLNSNIKMNQYRYKNQYGKNNDGKTHAS